MNERIPKDIEQLINKFIKDNDLQVLHVLRDRMLLMSIFPGTSLAAKGLRHDIVNLVGGILGNFKLKLDEAAALGILKLKDICLNALGLPESEFESNDLEFYVPSNVTKRVPENYYAGTEAHDEDVIVYYKGAMINDLKRKVNRSAGHLLARFSSNVDKNLKDLVTNGMEYLFCPAFIIENGNIEGFFISNSGPLIPPEIFNNLGKANVSNKTTSSNVERGIGLASLSELCKKQECSLIVTQWDNENIFIRDLSNELTLSSPLTFGNSEAVNSLIDIGLNVREKALSPLNHSWTNFKRETPNVIFGIIANKGNLFEPASQAK